jgi:uncharacterized protein YukJ
MPINSYGVLKGKIVDTKQGSIETPHFQVHIQANQVDYRIAINTMSQDSPADVLYFVSEDFKSEDITILPTLGYGFTKIDKNNHVIALDYVRGGLFDPSKMIPLPPDKEGPDNDLNEKIQRYTEEAQSKDATVYAFGERWGPEARKKDRYFQFLPGNGIHDIHMNQGNSKGWEKDDGIWQDGGVLIHFEKENRWVGIFLAFQSQSWCTDDHGHATRPVSECSHLTTNRVE